MDDLRLVGWEVSTLLEPLASKIQALDYSATSGGGLESQSKCPRVSWETKIPSIWKATSPKIPQGSTGLEPQRKCYRVSWEMDSCLGALVVVEHISQQAPEPFRLQM